MNVRLQYELDFMAGIYYDGLLQLNHYSISLQLITQTTDQLRINVAMERLKAFVYGELCDTVFVGPQDQDKVEMLSMLGINVTTLPDQPVDQIIGVMLYCKLNAIMENQMLITKLDIQSTLGDSVWYQYDEDDAIGPFQADGWWHKPTCQHNDIEPITESDNVVRVATTGWSEYRLNWPEETENTGNTVVFANFQKNENEPTR